MLDWLVHITFLRNILRRLLEDCNSITFLTKHIVSLFYLQMHLLSYFNELFILKLLILLWKILPYSLIPGVWYVAGLLETIKVSASISIMVFSRNSFSLSEYIFKVSADRRYIVSKRKKSLKNHWSGYSCY